MSRMEIPTPVMAAVAKILGDHYYSHTKLNTLFMEAGAPGDVPPGNCTEKCFSWFKRCNEDHSVEPLIILGRVLQEFMDEEYVDPEHPKARLQERVRNVLARNGLRYELNGNIFHPGSSPTARTLGELLKSGDLSAVESEFDRALSFLDTDPPSSVTAASSLLESLFKTYIADEGLALPATQDINTLWRIVRDDLGLDPALETDEDMKRILSGIITIISNVGSLRTHAGSAHGRSANHTQLTSPQARLAVNAAHTVAIFVIECWQRRTN